MKKFEFKISDYGYIYAIFMQEHWFPTTHRLTCADHPSMHSFIGARIGFALLHQRLWNKREIYMQASTRKLQCTYTVLGNIGSRPRAHVRGDNIGVGQE